MEFTAVHSKEATNTSRPYYRWLPTSVPSSSFPSLWKWGILLKQIWLTAFTCPKPFSGIPCPQEVKLYHGSHVQDSLSACLLFGLCLLLFSLRCSLLWAFPCAASSLMYNLKILSRFVSYLKSPPMEALPAPKPDQIPKHSGLDHHQTWLSCFFFFFNVCPFHKTVSQLRQRPYLSCPLEGNVWLWASA